METVSLSHFKLHADKFLKHHLHLHNFLSTLPYQCKKFSLPKFQISFPLFRLQFIGLELFSDEEYMSCAHNCIFVVYILQFILSKLILYLNFVK